MRWKYYIAADECWGPDTLEELEHRASQYFYIDWNSKEQMASGLIRYTSSKANLYHLFVPETHPMFNLDEVCDPEPQWGRRVDHDKLLHMYELEGG